jgi:hypothetical protein
MRAIGGFQHWLLLIFAAISPLLCAASSALADKRVALVIGNSAYKHAGRLLNAGNDAEIGRAHV